MMSAQAKRGTARRRRWRSAARVFAVLAAAFAIADLFRWANRWYVSARFTEPDEALYALQFLQGAHAAVVAALSWSLVALAAAAFGWRLRLVRGALGR